MRHIATAVFLAAFVLTGCAGPEYRAPAGQPAPTQAYPAGAAQTPYPGTGQAPYTVAYGTVQSIQPVNVQGSGGVGMGTVAGGVVGGLLGSQVGSGTGKTVATVAGAVGGAAVGNRMENQGRTAYQIGVRLDNGNSVNITQDSAADLQIGSRVRIDSNNRVYRY